MSCVHSRGKPHRAVHHHPSSSRPISISDVQVDNPVVQYLRNDEGQEKIRYKLSWFLYMTSGSYSGGIGEEATTKLLYPDEY